MLTPSKLSIKPRVLPIIVPEYDFESQIRWDGTLMAGSHTFNSIQTFGSNGQPCDTKNDSND